MKLSSQPVFFLDIQTTGATPLNSHILEIAWSKMEDPTISMLIEQPNLEPIPRRIKMVTGVTDAEMENAIAFPEVMSSLQEFIKIKNPANAICIIHFAQFEKPFLKAAFSRFTGDIPFPIICTHTISKKLFPNLPSRGIKGLAGFFGNNTGEFKRASSHVDATKMIWEKLIEKLSESGILTILDLNNWLLEAPKVSRTKYEYPLPKDKRLVLPDVPGIYRMLNSAGEVLYVGKATSLHSRVNSYFRGQKKRDSRKLEMLAQVYDLHVTPCESPLEAALMETDEIKRLNPYYNIALKAGHSALVFFNHDFNLLSNTSDHDHTIGPFSSALLFQPMLKLNSFAENISVNPMPDENLFYESIEPELIKSGLEVLCSRHHLTIMDLSSMRKIMALGLIWNKRINRQIELDETDIEITEEEEEEVEEVPLTPEDIADKFERHFMRVGRAYIKSKKLNALLNSNIEYSLKDGAPQRLVIHNGIISKNSSILQKTTEYNCWETEAIATYDRMTVLMTELLRIRSQEGHFKIECL